MKIRFIEYPREGKKSYYSLQFRWRFIWRDYVSYHDYGYGSSTVLNTNEDKDLLLDEFIEEKFNTTRKFKEITEYPSLKKY